MLGLGVSCGPVAPPVPPPVVVHHVVAIGDSYASGQGAPDKPISWWPPRWSPEWDDPRCNRSKKSATAQAIDQLEEADPSFGADLQSFACSGASIERGVLGPYRGSEPPPDPADLLPPQIEKVRELVDGGQPIDALTITVGGNDILFEYLVAACMFSWSKWEPECDLLNPVVEKRLNELRARLDSLALALHNVDPTLAPKVLLVEYPDPARNASGGYCRRSPKDDLLRGISECEAQWASECVLPRLNHQLCEVAAVNGWHYVDGVATRFRQHGWCADERWINTINQSWKTQGHYRGGVHPNKSGYREVASALSPALKQTLLGPPHPPTQCPALSLPDFCAHPCGRP
jgi:lysophospholipase L1-like esterase